jgi:hypothetical protein
MKRFLASILLISLCFAVTAHAEPLACLDKQPCPPGTEPPFCCDKPPCEFREQIRLKQAMRNVFSNKKVRAKFKKQAKGDNPMAAAKLFEYVKQQAKGLGNTIKCKWDFNKFPPSFEVVDCHIVAKLETGDREMTKEEALNKIETCTEFIEAAYKHEEFHKQGCDPEKKAKQGIEEYANEEIEGYTKEIDYLKAQRQLWWQACSVDQRNRQKKEKQEKAKQNSAKKGLDSLKKNAKKSNSQKPKIGK